MTSSATPLPTRRADLLARLAEPRVYDVAIVGGGATGLGVALDAAARGLSVVLVEAVCLSIWACLGAFSASTKAVTIFWVSIPDPMPLTVELAMFLLLPGRSPCS